eukprot:m.172035 g.172035  ORF g.172035 m.172035 type:complete len:460 (+) comp25200_c0_seq3:15-1394(+)
MSAPAPLDFSQEGSFPFETLKTRMPVILTRAIDDIHKAVRHHSDDGKDPNLIREAQKSIGGLTRLKFEMQTDKPLQLLDDSDPDVSFWNKSLQETIITPSAKPESASASRSKKKTDKPKASDERLVEASWWRAPWLLVECYLYRRIRAVLLQSKLLADYDPFANQKQQSFHVSLAAISVLGHLVHSYCKEKTGDVSQQNQFHHLVQFALWGNKSDLSLNAHFDGSKGSLDELQVNSVAGLNSLEENILVNDFPALWKRVALLKSTTIDFVLDNAGYELFTDLCLAHWLTIQGHATTIVFHTKTIPWFVSDTSNTDFHWMLEQLAASENATLKALAATWQQNLQHKVWRLQPDIIWTIPQDFRQFSSLAPPMFHQLQQSSLVFFKGDLNYRKLLGDLQWDYTTAFTEAIGDMKAVPLCALRTLKSPVMSGLTSSDVVTQLHEKNSSWLTCGAFAVIQTAF